MKLFAIILNYNRKIDTKECVDSLLRSSHSEFTIVVVDNGSSDGSAPFLKEHFPQITLIETGKNLGYAGGNNVGIRFALEQGADNLLILNNDTILDEDCIKNFILMHAKFPRHILGSRILQFDEPDEMQHFGGLWDAKKGKFINMPRDLSDRKGWDEPRELDFVTGCSIFVPAELFQTIGLFEEDFFLYYEEIDFCFRAAKAGFPCLYCPTAVLWHKEARSFASPRPPQSYYQWRNRAFFVERNFSKPIYYRWLVTKYFRRVALLAIKRFIKEIEYRYYSLVNKEGYTKEKEVSLLAYRASLQGVVDYLRRKFGQGPNWILKK